MHDLSTHACQVQLLQMPSSNVRILARKEQL